MTSTPFDSTDIMLGEATYRTDASHQRAARMVEAQRAEELAALPRVTHKTFRDIQNAGAMRLERQGAQVDQARHEVEKLQLQLEAATRELARLETIEAATVREMDAAWEAQADFESLELERAFEESERLLEFQTVQLHLLAEAREELEEDD